MKVKDLELRDGIYYLKASDVPFTGILSDNGNGKGEIINGRKEGFWKYFPSFLGSSRQGNYKNGKKEGLWETYHLNGDELLSKGSYKNGKKEGIWLELNSSSGESGKKYDYKNYKDGEKDGYWEEFCLEPYFLETDVLAAKKPPTKGKERFIKKGITKMVKKMVFGSFIHPHYGERTEDNL